MTNHLSLAELAVVSGGQASDAIGALKRAGDHKPKGGSLDVYGYSETERRGVGAEIRQRINPNVSIFANGRIGTKNDKPDNGVMGGIRFEW